MLLTAHWGVVSSAKWALQDRSGWKLCCLRYQGSHAQWGQQAFHPTVDDVACHVQHLWERKAGDGGAWSGH